jgi:hypothetical protein
MGGYAADVMRIDAWCDVMWCGVVWCGVVQVDDDILCGI